VPAESQVEYAVQELFFGRPAAQTTTGSTKSVEGQFTAELRVGKLTLQSNQFKVDLRTLQSDNQVRDQAIRSNWLESNKYPYAEFTSTNIQGLPPELKEGVTIPFKIDGNMTIRGITKPLTFSASATLNGDTLTGTGTTLLYMKDFGFAAPDLAGRLTVTDGVTLTIKGTAKLAQTTQP
jgi:polyisoprenoid-binding protein YceI